MRRFFSQTPRKANLVRPLIQQIPKHHESPFITQSLHQQTYYRRPLPHELTSFTSKRGRQMFQESMASGTAELYFSLAGNFTHQSEPAFCGLGSLAMCLNALEVDPQKTWKGVWRWYSEEMLECCASLDYVRQHGVTFDEFVCLARCNGLDVQAKRGDEVTQAEFVSDLEEACASQNRHLVVSFSRQTLGQTGDGHFSPIGALHKQSGQVLVLDTARFKYPSYFCPIDLLYKALKPIDRVTGLPRGYTILTKRSRPPHTVCRLSSRIDWTTLCHVIGNHVPRKLGEIDWSGASVVDLVERILTLLPEQYQTLVQMKQHGVDLAGNVQETAEIMQHHNDSVIDLIEQTERHPMYKVVQQVFSLSPLIKQQLHTHRAPGLLGIDFVGASHLPHRSDLSLITLFLLASPKQMYSTLPVDLRSRFESLKDLHQQSLITSMNGQSVRPGNNHSRTSHLLHQEVSHIKYQIETLTETYCSCSINPHSSKCPVKNE